VATYLDEIIAWHRRRAEADHRPLDALLHEARSRPPTRGFEAALRNAAVRRSGLAVIAEIKRRSPSKGALAPDLDPAALAGAYARGGAAALSVLTDVEHFGGSADDLVAARAAVDLPVLRKDFTVCAADVADARLMGADACLLIVAALTEAELSELLGIARDLGIDALVECHDEDEIVRALAAGATLVGVNQRDLVTFRVDTDRAVRVASGLPAHVVRVAESGVDGPDAAARLAAAGYHAILVGEHLVRSADPAASLQALVGVAP
jgi:indole-3-glycerol phosphate synthase